MPKLKRWLSVLIFAALLGTGCMPIDIQQPVANKDTLFILYCWFE